MSDKHDIPKKIPLVLFSGGLDSTSALMDALVRSDVDVVYIAGRQGPHKINAELQAVEDIIEMLKATPTEHQIQKVYRFKLETDSYVDNYVHDYVSGQRFSQPQQWLFGMTAIARPDRHSEVVLSYVTGDQMASHLTELHWIWDYLCGIVFGTENKIPLAFPFRYSKKRDLINHLPLGILAKTWTCEIPLWEGGDRDSKYAGVELDLIPSLKELKSDRSYKYLPCEKCSACLAQKESYITSMYETHSAMMDRARASFLEGAVLQQRSET